jgi:uncharacterized protein
VTAAPDYPPQPLPDTDSAPFWEATAEGRLALCRCQACGLWMQPPLERCRACGEPTAFEEIRGTGVIYSFIVQHHAAVPGYRDQLPYVIGLVQLDEQPRLRLPGRIVGIDATDVVCGLRVRAEIVALPGGDFEVPVFRPIEDR